MGAHLPLALVIEDRSSVQQLLKAVMIQEGFAVVGAENVDDGLAAASEARPDVVLLDLLLPGRSSLYFIQSLRSLPGGRDVPVIVISGVEGGLAASRAAGAQEFLAKPFDVRQLVERVRHHTGLRQAPAPAP